MAATGKIIIYIVIGLLSLIAVVLAGTYYSQKNQNRNLMQNVTASVQTEFDKLQLPNQIEEQKYEYGSECDYDTKVGVTRCSVRYTKYFVADEQPIDKFMEVDKYVMELGWVSKYNTEESRDSLIQLLEIGQMPSKLYEKTYPYPMELHVSFIGERDREFSDQKRIEILDRYSNEYPALYTISISTDIM